MKPETHAISIELVRGDNEERYGTPGELIVWTGGSVLFECRTLELDWCDNERDVSCIPEGDYNIIPRTYGGFFEKAKADWGHEAGLWIKDVPGRDNVLVHWGNFLRCTKGCVLVGERAGVHASQNCVWQSQKAYRRLYKVLHPYLWHGGGNASSFPLLIRNGLAEDEPALTKDRKNI